MYLWQIEYNKNPNLEEQMLLWIALNYVSLTDWIQQGLVSGLNNVCCESL